MVLTVETSQSRTRIAVGARTQVFRSGRPCDVRPRVRDEPGRVETEVAIAVAAGEQVTVEKVVALYTGCDWAVSEPAEAVVAELARADGFDALLQRHEVAWAHLWERFGATLEGDGPLGLQVPLALRLNLFHLLQTLSV